jgi:hypothetical protein
MKNHISLSFLILSLNAVAQCPVGEVILSSQTDVNAFVAEYSECTEIDGALTIEILDGDDTVEDLSGLNNLTTINGSLSIYGMNDAGNPVSLQGMENITSTTALSVGGSSGPFSEKLHLVSLSPLENIQGQLFVLRFSQLSVQEEFPDFTGLTSATEIHIEFVEGALQTPQFPNLNECALFSVLDITSNLDGIESIYIPDNLPEIAFLENGPVPQLTIAGCMNLSEIIGGSSLTYAESINISNNPVLNNLSGLDQVATAPSVNISGCTEGVFNILPNLSNTSDLYFEVNNPEGICTNYIDELLISVGANSSGIDTNTVDLTLAINEVGSMEFAPNFTSMRKFNLSAINTESVVGFSDLESVEGMGTDNDLKIGGYSCTALPDFSNLVSVEGVVEISLGAVPSPVLNFEGFESLTTVGNLLVYGPGNSNAALESFVGLESLTNVTNGIRVQGFQFLEDLSALQNLETVGRINLIALPALIELPDFDDLQSPIDFYLNQVGLSVLPQFPNISEMLGIRLQNNSNLLSADFPNIELFTGFMSSGNEQLTEITASDPVEVSGGLIITGNSSLENCGVSPTLCQMIETAANVEFMNNGSGCNSISSIAASCETLSTDDFHQGDFRAWTDYNGHLVLAIPEVAEASISLFDLQGRIVLSEIQFSVQGMVSLPIQNIGTGVYLVSLQTQQGVGTTKVFIP